MKNTTLYFFVFSFLFFISCTSENSTNNETEDSIALHAAEAGYDDPVENREAVKPPPPPTKDEETKTNEKKFIKKSPFRDLGCCDEEETREEKCCCLKVLEEYKKMHNAGDLKKLANYSMTDPILGTCKRKIPDAFDLIDHPPAPKKEEEDNYDDLF